MAKFIYLEPDKLPKEINSANSLILEMETKLANFINSCFTDGATLYLNKITNPDEPINFHEAYNKRLIELHDIFLEYRDILKNLENME
jgi:hypothetical protein